MAINDDKFLALRNPGIKGWSTFDQPATIDDLELADVQNISYQKGFISPREGSDLLYAKPSSETGDSLQLIRAQTSDGVEYLVAVYANHFYVRHEANNEWIRINQTYVPAETTLFYGNVNWQNGRGDDRLYVCNGVDDFIRWNMCVDTVDGAHVAGAATVTLNDGSRFPSGGGTLILKSSGGTFFTEAYTSRAGNVFTLTNTLDNTIEDNSSATVDMIQKGSMELGKYVTKFQRRLVIGNYYGGETVVWASVQGDPEDFSLAATIAGGFTQTIADGNGEITGLHDFGTFIVIEKQDSIHSLSLQIAADLGTKLAVVNPLVAGESIGPLGAGSTVKIFNQLFYPTRSNGFISNSPATSGNSVSTNVQPLSQKIDSYIDTSLELSYSRAATANNRVYWSVALKGAVINTLVLEYDVLRNAWSKHFGWGVKDLVEKDDEVLYLDNGSGAVYQINNGAYNDAGNEYLTSAAFKRFDFGEIGRPKSQGIVYVEGFMTPASEFFIDLNFNEAGVLGKQTYRINISTTGLSFSDPITDSQGQFTLGFPILGGVTLQGIGDVSIFRCYLAMNTSKAFYNIQPRVYGTRAAFWGITAMAMNPEVLPIAPLDFIVAPIIST